LQWADPIGLPADPLAASAVSVYPNPSASGVFTVRVPAAPSGATFVVFDAVGRTVAAGALAGGAETPLNLRAQPAGVYALRLRWPNGQMTTKKLLR
jgi:hypothetical protein